MFQTVRMLVDIKDCVQGLEVLRWPLWSMSARVATCNALMCADGVGSSLAAWRMSDLSCQDGHSRAMRVAGMALHSMLRVCYRLRTPSSSCSASTARAGGRVSRP